MTDPVMPPTSYAPLATRWNPWRALVEEHPDYQVISDYELPGSICGLTSFPKKRIWLCKLLSDVQRECTLAHELVHIERGMLPEDRLEAIAEERAVEEIAARRMIPTRDLLHVAVTRPSSTSAAWAALLRVDRQTLHVRLRTLKTGERAALRAARGGKVPAVTVALFDDPDVAHPVPAYRKPEAARRVGGAK